MKRTKISVGDVFQVALDNGKYKYFQYLLDDATQLNSNVIGCFPGEFESEVDISKVIDGEFETYIHCVLPLGLKLGYWRRIGNFALKLNCDIVFRDSSDYGNPEIIFSQKWWIWKPNEPQKYIGDIQRDYANSFVGIVVNPSSVVHMIKTGAIDFVYPRISPQ